MVWYSQWTYHWRMYLEPLSQNPVFSMFKDCLQAKKTQGAVMQVCDSICYIFLNKIKIPCSRRWGAKCKGVLSFLYNPISMAEQYSHMTYFWMHTHLVEENSMPLGDFTVDSGGEKVGPKLWCSTAQKDELRWWSWTLYFKNLQEVIVNMWP